jgi:hypothetical protein
VFASSKEQSGCRGAKHFFLGLFITIERYESLALIQNRTVLHQERTIEAHPGHTKSSKIIGISPPEKSTFAISNTKLYGMRRAARMSRVLLDTNANRSRPCEAKLIFAVSVAQQPQDLRSLCP